METRDFIRRHRDDWTELEALVRRCSKSPRKVQAGEIERLFTLYRAASSQLAFIRTQAPKDPLTAKLNKLVSEAHNIVHLGKYRSADQLRGFFLETFVRLIDARIRFIVLAALLFLLGGIAGSISVMHDTENLYRLFPSFQGAVDPERLGEGHADINSPVMSTEIFINNIRVAVLAFASGITLGIGTVYLLIYNGLLIGALSVLFYKSGKFYDFWAYILPHGIIELTVIFIAGGAGLYMGYRIWVPGNLPRKVQLVESAKESVQLLVATFPLFVLAGVIEGYVTPSTELSLGMKYLFACSTLLFLFVFYGFGKVRAGRIHTAERRLTARSLLSSPDTR